MIYFSLFGLVVQVHTYMHTSIQAYIQIYLGIDRQTDRQTGRDMIEKMIRMTNEKCACNDERGKKKNKGIII